MPKRRKTKRKQQLRKKMQTRITFHRSSTRSPANPVTSTPRSSLWGETSSAQGKRPRQPSPDLDLGNSGEGCCKRGRCGRHRGRHTHIQKGKELSSRSLNERVVERHRPLRPTSLSIGLSSPDQLATVSVSQLLLPLYRLDRGDASTELRPVSSVAPSLGSRSL